MSSANYMFVRSAISVWRKLFTNVSYVFWLVYEGLGIKMKTEMGDRATKPPAVLAVLFLSLVQPTSGGFFSKFLWKQLYSWVKPV